MPGEYRIIVALMGLTGLVSARLEPQNRPGSAAPHRRFGIGLEMVRSPAWDLEVRTGSFVNRRATYDAGWSAGLQLHFALIPATSLYAGGAWNGGGFGDTSGWSTIEVGTQIRPLPTKRLGPIAVAGIGRASESGGVRFSYLTFGGGVQLRLSPRFSADAALRQLAPLSASDSRESSMGGISTEAIVDASMTRIHARLTIWL